MVWQTNFITMVILLTSVNTGETDLVSSIVWLFYLLKKQHKTQPAISYHIYMYKTLICQCQACEGKKSIHFS